MSQRPSRIGALLCTVACALAFAVGCIPLPDFYVPPDTLPDDPGDIVRTFPVLLNKQQTYRGTAVMYRSNDALDQPNVVTGTLYEPKEAWAGSGPRPLIAFAVGTQGVGDKCAPSQTLPTGSNYELGTIQALLNQGWAVAVTDYDKLGTPGDPTYIIKDAEAHAVLDMVRAVGNLTDTDVTADSPVGLWGYSQGGQASAAAAEIESTYAPELDIVGAVAGGVPSDLVKITDWLNRPPGNDYFAVLTFAALGLDSAYPELDLSSYLNADGKLLFDAVHTTDNICLFDAITLLKGKTIEDFTTTNPLETVPAWQQRVAQQKLGSKVPQVPVFQFHGNIDQLVPYDQGTTLRDAWCAAGADVTFKDYPTDHFGGLVAGNNDGIAFMTARFAGTPSTLVVDSRCRRRGQ